MIHFEVESGKYLLVNDKDMHQATFNLGVHVEDRSLYRMYKYLHAVRSKGRAVSGYNAAKNGYPSDTVKSRRKVLGMIVANFVILKELQENGYAIPGIEVSKTSATQNLMLAKAGLASNDLFWGVVNDLLVGGFIEFKRDKTFEYHDNKELKKRSVIAPTQKLYEFINDAKLEDVCVSKKLYADDVVPVKLAGEVSSKAQAVRLYESFVWAYNMVYEITSAAVNVACNHACINLNPIDRMVYLYPQDDYTFVNGRYAVCCNALDIPEVGMIVRKILPQLSVFNPSFREPPKVERDAPSTFKSRMIEDTENVAKMKQDKILRIEKIKEFEKMFENELK